MQIVGGVMLHVTRTAATESCMSKRRHLVHGCTAAAREQADVPSGTQTAPYGIDPAFDALSSLFSADASAQPGSYYNNTPGSPELFASGMPHGNFFRKVPGFATDGYPVVFPVRIQLASVLRACRLVCLSSSQCQTTRLKISSMCTVRWQLQIAMQS